MPRVELLGLRERVTFHGYVSEAELEAALDDADLAVNLRYPTMGEASGSQLRIWDHALPSLVTHYRRLRHAAAATPFSSCARNRSERTSSDICGDSCGTRGSSAKKAAARPVAARTPPARDVRDAAPGRSAKQADALRSRHNRLALAERVGRAIAPWSEEPPSDDLARRYAERIAGTV